jgi:hypothetical protein
LSAVTAQLGSVIQASGAGLYDQTKVTCIQLGSSIKAAQSAPPIPYPTMQRSYASSLTKLASAATDCQNAITIHPAGDEGEKTDLNKSLLTRTKTEFAADSGLLYAATAAIVTLGR